MNFRTSIVLGKAVVIIAFFLFPMFSFAQQGLVKGTVYDEFDSPLPGAEIKLVSDQSTISLTSIEGKYFLELPAGKHLIVASYTLLESDTVEVEIVSGQITEHDFVLVE